jgi:serine protease
VSSNSYGIAQCGFRGCNIDNIGFIPAVRDALELAQNRNNTVFVFTAGNEGMNEGSPNFRSSGSTPRVMIVGATRINGTRASYSNVGAANWIVAPAGDHNENVTWTSSVTAAGQQCGQVGVGTSWAAPMVSGAAAILRSVRLYYYP